MAKSGTTAGISLLAAGVILPPLVWFGGQALLAAEAARDPRLAQVEMVGVFLAFWASVAVAGVLGVVGLLLLLPPEVAMSDRREPSEGRPPPAAVLIGAVLLAAGAGGSLFGYLITGTAQGTLLGALGTACLCAANAIVSVLKPALPVALGIGVVAGFAGGVCLLGILVPEQPGWAGGVTGAGIGVAEVLLGRWRRRKAGTGGAAEQRGPAEPLYGQFCQQAHHERGKNNSSSEAL